ncbi:CBN-CIDS-1 protein [Caenorhabditis brenneri]|uniref:CBN-CIDS-1 protein n=1 Tax=Caenorhabditis brenneri TaxID=135651 RepID=G0N5H4_CAEBE|nr:CBN-CIDS-1 protein [Caenorhabditis brenneri]
MSDFTEHTLRQKLVGLSNNSNSIQSTSAWLLKNHNNREIIIRVWLRTVKKEVKGQRIVNLLYVANDVAQNARKSCPQFKDDFLPAIESAFRHSLETASKEVESAVGKLINIWKERQIYTPSQCKRLQEVHNQMKLSGSFPSPASKDNGNNAQPGQFIVEEAKKNAQDVLISLKRLQNPPSTEREIRVQLSKYPDNISCPEKLQSVQNSQEAKKLLAQNEEALPMLEDYVRRLKEETKERETMENNLNTLIQNVRMSIEHHEKLCREVKRKEDRIKADLLEVEKTFESLPDLTADLPNTPLPSLEPF